MIRQLSSTTYEKTMPSGDKVEIGNIDSKDFKPHIKLNRWDGECFIKVGLPTTKKITPVIEGDKTRWIDRDIEVDFYSIEPTTVIAKDKDGKDHSFIQNELGGFEFEVILKKKPKTNKIILDIETQNLTFFYQPELTPEEIEEGAVRPDNVVGSYVVYHTTRTNMHRSRVDADKYRTGIAFRIYRPKITDAKGKQTWGELSLDEQTGTLTITIAQSWLDSVVYPVSIDPNFGYDTIGGSLIANFFSDFTQGARPHNCPEAGEADSVSVYIDPDADTNMKAAIYRDSDDDRIALTEEIVATAGAGWKLLNVTSGETLANEDYVLAFLTQDQNYDWYYDTVAGFYRAGKNTTWADPFPDPISWTSKTYHLNKSFSIYCTYTPSAPPAAVGWGVVV